MIKPVETIGILTSGGDAPGMNAAIRAVVRTAIANGKRVLGFYRGYRGLLDQDYVELDARSVADIITRGGTMLYTARCHRMRSEEGQQLGAKRCEELGVDGLIVIGGDGSFKGAYELSKLGVNVVGIPGTIDLDIACTEYTIGFDTAINTAMECIDKVRDTSTSHERVSIIEVMGRKAGYIALYCGIANGAEDILITEKFDNDEERIIQNIIEKKKVGKKHHIIINAEGIGDSNGLAERIEKATGMEARASIIGYIQRGGSPTCKDRVYASAMGAKAVDILCAGGRNRVVGYRNGSFVDFSIEEALSMYKGIDEYLYILSKRLSR